MRFWEAMRALEEGKKVRCKSWARSDFWDNDDKKPNYHWDDCKYRVSRMMSEEWELFQEPEQLLTFAQVVEGLKEGKKFRRKSWPDLPEFTIHLIEKCLCDGTGSDFELTYIEDFEANDWVRVENAFTKLA